MCKSGPICGGEIMMIFHFCFTNNILIDQSWYCNLCSVVSLVRKKIFCNYSLESCFQNANHSIQSKPKTVKCKKVDGFRGIEPYSKCVRTLVDDNAIVGNSVASFHFLVASRPGSWTVMIKVSSCMLVYVHLYERGWKNRKRMATLPSRSSVRSFIGPSFHSRPTINA